MRRLSVAVGALCLVLGVLAGVVFRDSIREAWARGPQLLNSSAIVDDAAFTPEESGALVCAATFDDVAPDSVDEGDGGALRMSANRNLYSTIRDAAGNERGLNVNAAGGIAVTVAATQVDDAVFTPATSSVSMSGYFFDDVAPDSVDEDDGGAGRMSANRNIYQTIRDAAGNERGADVSAAFDLEVADDIAAALLTTIDSDTNDIKTAVEIIDNIVETNRAATNPISGQVGIAGGTGVDGATVVRVSLATDISLPAGTNGIGKLTANSGVDIGDVDVTDVIPGTGATNLGKAQGSVHGAGGTGVMILAVHTEDQVHTSVADGSHEALIVDSLGSLHVNPESHHVFNDMNTPGDWGALSDATTTIASSTNHIVGSSAVSFNKVNGSGETNGAICDTLGASLDLGAVSLHDILQAVVYIPALTVVDYVFIRLGEDASNYNEWRIQDDDLTAATWESLAFEVGGPNHGGNTGTGWDPSSIEYMCLGVGFDAESDALSGIIFDEFSYHTNQHTNAIIGSEVSSSVSSANVNLQKVGGSATDKGAGNASNGSQRIVIADDDTNTLKTTNAVEIMDDWDETNRAAVNLIASQVGVAADQGVSSALTVRTVEVQPNGETCTVVDPDQIDAADIAANANRLNIFCQNQGTEAVMLRLGATSGGTTGIVLHGGSVALDGLGASKLLTTTASIYLYDLDGNGNADTTCCQATN